MFGAEDMSAVWRIVPAVLPVAGYFFILGLLNSRRHPRMLSGRLDFAVMVGALSPIFVLPVLEYVGLSLWTVSVVFTALAAIVLLLAPRGASYVIYNIPASQARSVVAEAVKALGLEGTPDKEGLLVAGGRVLIGTGHLPLLNNVSVRLEGGGREFARRFRQALGRQLSQTPAEESRAGVTMLLIATAMMIAPLTLVAQRVPEVVRIITDLLP